MELGRFQACRVCGRYDFANEHRCPPTFWVRFDYEDESDARPAYGRDIEEAVEGFCERYDEEGEYSIIRSGEAVVFARKTDDDPWTEYHVEAESRPHYTAREAD